MMWVAVVYAALGSWLTYKIGRPLVRINFDLERYNADFRYRMTRIRENAESIALYEGEPDEERRLRRSLSAASMTTWWDYMKLQQAADLADRLLRPGRRHLPVPGRGAALFRRRDPRWACVMQTASAFGQVQSSLSWFVNSFDTLADWKATVDRLTGFSRGDGRRPRAAAGDRAGFDVADDAAAGARRSTMSRWRCRTAGCCSTTSISSIAPGQTRGDPGAVGQRQDHPVSRAGRPVAVRPGQGPHPARAPRCCSCRRSPTSRSAR